MTSLASSNGDVPHSNLATQPILLQYVFFLALCALETASFHLPLRALLSTRFPRPISWLIPYYPKPALISTSLLVSSFTKLFPLLLLVWQYDLPSSASAVSWAVIINNVAALEILLDCGYFRSIILCAVGAVCRAGIGWVSSFACSPTDRQALISFVIHRVFCAQSAWVGARQLLGWSRLEI